MFTRTARLLLVAMCALLVAGCGGGAEAPAISSDTAVDSNAAGAGAADVPAGQTDPSTGQPLLTEFDKGADGDGAEVTAAPGNQVQTSEATPKAFTNAVGKHTIVVVLHQPRSTLDDVVVAQARFAVARFKNIKYFQFTIAEYKTYEDVPEKLGLFGSPAVAVINRSGQVQNFWPGVFVDANLISRSIVVAQRTAEADVKPGADAPPAPNAFDGTAADAANSNVS